MSEAELDSYRTLVKRRAKREPVAYILGRREFYGRDFVVDRRVLIPRPDTEVLIDEVLARLSDDASGVVVDYGTGSGAIALTLAAERPGLSVLGLDISEDALSAARANADRLGLRERVGFVRSDGLSALPPRFLNKVVALVANPPYVPEEDREGLMPEVRDHEPQSALFAGPDPLLHYRRLAAEGPAWMHSDAFISVEVGAGQSTAVAALLEDAGWTGLSVRSDLARHERVVSATAPANDLERHAKPGSEVG